MTQLLRFISRTSPGIVSIPPLVLLYWIISFGVDLPFYDEWVFMGSVLKEQLRGDFNFYDFFTPHNDHRIFTTYLTFALLENIGSWSRWYFFFLNFVTAVGTFFLIFKYFINSNSDRISYFILFIAALLHFSAMQLENWTWGFQIQWFHCSFFSLLTLILLNFYSNSKVKFLFAIFAAIITSLTIAGGLFIWIAGLCVCIHQILRREREWLTCILWLAAGVMTWWLYQQGLPEKNLLSSFLTDPILAIKTFLTLIGAPIANFNWGTALVVGAFGVGVFILFTLICVQYLFHKNNNLEENNRFILWYSWGFFCLLSAIAISLARFTMGGPSYVLEASRYTTITTPFWISLLLVYSNICHKFNLKLFSLILVPFCFVYFFSTQHSLSAWKYRGVILAEARNVILSYDPALLSQFEEPKAAIKRIGFINEETVQLLRKGQLTPFTQKNIDLNVFSRAQDYKTPVGFIDSIEELKTPHNEIVTHIRGWALDPIDLSREDTSVVVLYQDEILAEVPTYLLRPDVNATYKLDDSVKAGWQMYIVRGGIIPSKVSAYLISEDRKMAFTLDKNPAFLLPN